MEKMLNIVVLWHIYFILVCTVLCKSNASEFRRISWLFLAFRGKFAPSEIAAIFPRTFEAPIVSIWRTFEGYFSVDANESRTFEGKFPLLESSLRTFERKFALVVKCSHTNFERNT